MSQNIIAFNRGDTYDFTITIADSNATNGLYTLLDNDKVYLGITQPFQPFETAIIKKVYTAANQDAGIIQAVIEPEDTVDLFPGVYYYSVKLVQDHDDEEGNHCNDIMTIVDRTKFVIKD